MFKLFSVELKFIVLLFKIEYYVILYILVIIVFVEIKKILYICIVMYSIYLY